MQLKPDKRQAKQGKDQPLITFCSLILRFLLSPAKAEQYLLAPCTVKLTFTWISSHLMSFSTSSWLKRMNSSCWTTSGKCFWLNTSAACIKSTQLCVSAKSRIPKQLDGSSWLSRNSQQACFTPVRKWNDYLYFSWLSHKYFRETKFAFEVRKPLTKNIFFTALNSG